MIPRPQRLRRLIRDARKEGRLLAGGNWGAAFSRLPHSQYQPPTGANGKYRIGAEGGASAFGCVGSSGCISASAGEEGTFMIGRLLRDGDE